MKAVFRTTRWVRLTGVFKPQRTCLGCRKKLEATELCRLQLQLSDEGSVVALVISSTSVGGRGAWLCKADQVHVSDASSVRVRVSCATAAKQKKAFARGFRRDGPPDVVNRYVDGFLTTQGDD